MKQPKVRREGTRGVCAREFRQVEDGKNTMLVQACMSPVSNSAASWQNQHYMGVNADHVVFWRRVCIAGNPSHAEHQKQELCKPDKISNQNPGQCTKNHLSTSLKVRCWVSIIQPQSFVIPIEMQLNR
jgi:hypothetical protein